MKRRRFIAFAVGLLAAPMTLFAKGKGTLYIADSSGPYPAYQPNHRTIEQELDPPAGPWRIVEQTDDEVTLEVPIENDAMCLDHILGKIEDGKATLRIRLRDTAEGVPFIPDKWNLFF